MGFEKSETHLCKRLYYKVIDNGEITSTEVIDEISFRRNVPELSDVVTLKSREFFTGSIQGKIAHQRLLIHEMCVRKIYRGVYNEVKKESTTIAPSLPLIDAEKRADKREFRGSLDKAN